VESCAIYAKLSFRRSFFPYQILSTSDDESFKLFLCTLVDIVVPVLFPFLTPSAESIAQLAEEEVEILICFREGFLELLIQFIDFVLLRSVLDEIVEELQVFTRVCQISLTVHFPAAL